MKGCAFSIGSERRFLVAHSGRTESDTELRINLNAA